MPILSNNKANKAIVREFFGRIHKATSYSKPDTIAERIELFEAKVLCAEAFNQLNGAEIISTNKQDQSIFRTPQSKAGKYYATQKQSTLQHMA